MKKHTIEKIIYIYNSIALFMFALWIISGILFKDPIRILDMLFSVSISVIPFSWIFLIIINYRRKKRGYKNYLSLECMKNAKNEMPKYIYKYVSLSSSYNSCQLDLDKLETLKNNQIWMSTAEFLNDVFEGQFWQITEEFKKKHTNEEIEIIEQQLKQSSNSYIQSSFSYERDNILMWSHYTNSFFGYCVEYEVMSKSFLFPILYTKKRIITNGDESNKLLVKNLKKIYLQRFKCSSLEEYVQYLFYIRTFKSEIWEYEKEIRLIKKSNKGSQYININAHGLKISKIIMGYKCKYEKELRNISKKLNVKFSVMKPNFENDKYSIGDSDLV